MSRRQVLVVEDDAAIRRGVCDALIFAGFDVEEAGTAADGAQLALSGRFDLALLDVVLPGGDGFSILRQIRQLHGDLPVIMLTARGEEPDRVLGLKTGADDYVVKPFGVKELLARVEAVLRRSPARPKPAAMVSFAGGVADLAAATVRHDDGSAAALSEKEVEVLRYLAGQAGRTVSRDERLARVWGLDPEGLSTRAIDMQIARLREKLRDDSAAPRTLVTVRGKGYMFVAAGQ